MSYCRFSFDDFQCDVYVYDDASGVSVHIARARVVFKKPLPPSVPFSQATLQAWYDRHNRVMEMMELADRELINLEHAGQSFFGMDPEDAANFLEELRGMGYRIPVHVVTALRDEGRSPEDVA